MPGWFVCVCVFVSVCMSGCVLEREKESKVEEWSARIYLCIYVFKCTLEEWFIFFLKTASSLIFVIYVGTLAHFMDTMNVKLKCKWLSREVRTLADKTFYCH